MRDEKHELGAHESQRVLEASCGSLETDLFLRARIAGIESGSDEEGNSCGDGEDDEEQEQEPFLLERDPSHARFCHYFSISSLLVLEISPSRDRPLHFYSISALLCPNFF